MVHRGVGPEPSGGAAAVADAAAPARARTARPVLGASAAGGCSASGCWSLVVLGAAAAPAGKPFRDVFTSRAPTRRRRSTSSTSGSRPRTSRRRRSSSTTRRARSPTRDRRPRPAAAIGKLPQVESVVAAAGLAPTARRSLLTVTYSVRPPTSIDLDTIDRLDGRDRAGRATPGITVAYGGQVDRLRPAADRAAEPRRRDRARSSAVIILIFVFGTVVAAFLPLDRRLDRRRRSRR